MLIMNLCCKITGELINIYLFKCNNVFAESRIDYEKKRNDLIKPIEEYQKKVVTKPREEFETMAISFNEIKFNILCVDPPIIFKNLIYFKFSICVEEIDYYESFQFTNLFMIFLNKKGVEVYSKKLDYYPIYKFMIENNIQPCIFEFVEHLPKTKFEYFKLKLVNRLSPSIYEESEIYKFSRIFNRFKKHSINN
ncbi:hypothetical protein NUSPORA_00760 [Nucleospora cyclopteri]